MIKILAVVFFCFLALPAFARDTPEIVILNSYHNGFAWSDDEMSGFLDQLQEVYPRVVPPVEYLDAKRFPDREHLERVAAFLADKYRNKKTKLVVCFDNPALDMLLDHRNELFPNVPIVFAGINGFDPKMLEGQRQVTGIAEQVDTKGTLEVALALHPKTKEVLVVTDQTVSGQAARRDVEAVAPAFASRLSFRYLSPVTFHEAAAMIGEVPADSIVLLDVFITDRAGTDSPRGRGHSGPDIGGEGACLLPARYAAGARCNRWPTPGGKRAWETNGPAGAGNPVGN